MSFVAWFYSFFFWHCLVIVCPLNAESSGDATCVPTYDSEHLQDWENHLMIGSLGDEMWTPVNYVDPGLDGWPFVRQSRCEIRRW